MRLQSSRCARIVTAVVVLVAALTVLRPIAAASPEDPQVKACVKKALAYLGTAHADDERLGAQCLTALCFIKAGAENHPKVAKALETCQKSGVKGFDNYSLGIIIMFLCEMDPKKHGVDPKEHHAVIVKYVDELLSRQKPFGAWSYPSYQTGDTSQTQYAVLGMWMAKNYAEIEIPVDRMEGVCEWLMRTQDPSGGWCYQGHDPGSLQRVPQTGVTTTLSASGAGSMYMMADLLQVTKRTDSPVLRKSKALQDVLDPAKKDPRSPRTVTLKPADVMSTLANTDRYLGTGFTPQPKWNHYYMYALERYHSFREMSGGVKDDKWYNLGFAHLQQSQNDDGSWTPEGDSDKNNTATCFATLFLLRSAQKAIVKKMGGGVAVGGISLPKDVRSMQVTPDGKVIDTSVVLNTEQILELIQKGPSEDVQRLADEKEALILSSNKTERQSQIETLRKFVGVGDYHSRRVAVVGLSKVRDLDNVPRLLFALTDPDSRIVVEADKGLRFISRKVNGVGLPESDPTTAQIQAAQGAWKAWFLSIRPNAELID